jgi:DNA-binding NarL/FixJ family response regulator
MKISVVIFEDNQFRRDGLATLISMTDGMECVGAFLDGNKVIEDIDACHPDIVVMDIDMPSGNGIEHVKKIRSRFPSIKILTQTVYEDDEKILASIRAGADGYILKKTPPHELINAITEVMNGGAPMTPVVARQVLRLLIKKDPETLPNDFDLTNREQETLSLLVQGLSYKMIAAKCHVSISTVNTHIQHIYKKLQVHSVVDAVTKAIANKIV